MTPVTFPLLKLPLMAIKNVVRSMTMEELFDLSHCSKKTQRYLKACSGKNLHFCVQISGDTSFSYYRENQYDDTFDFRLENTIFGFNENKRFNHTPPDRTIQLSPFQTPLEGVISNIYHFFDSFDLKIGELFIDFESVQNQFRHLIQSIFNRQTVFKHVTIFGPIDREDLKYFLEKSTTQESFVTDIKVESPHNFNLHTNIINFNKAGWLTAPNLLSMSFDMCELRESSFQLNDWVAILRAWINGWNPRMYHLSIEGDLEYETIVNRMPFGTMRDQSVVRYAKPPSSIFSTKRFAGHLIEGGFDITRDDGKIATVYSVEGPQIIEIHVWDNQGSR